MPNIESLIINHKSKLVLLRLICLGFVIAVGGCSTAEVAFELARQAHISNGDTDKGQGTDPGQKNNGGVVASPHYKIGDPYQIYGNWYYPERDLLYDETGIASWYGDQFAGKLTANGEIFDPELVTAAHKTLPMPSVVRVTNLDNGKSLVVKLNDRGPYVTGRIIDLSRAAARKLGFLDAGIAKVRVQILAEQSLAMERLARQNEFPLLPDSNSALPEVTPDNIPEVTMSARTTRKESVNQASGTSAIELLAKSRIGEVIEVPIVDTKIWVQIGAFYHLDNARAVLNSYTNANGRIAESLLDGKPIYKARLGPVKTVEAADILLVDVLQFGFQGAHIIVD